MAGKSTDWALKQRIDICIACCYTPTYYAKDDRGTIAKARELLDRHNIGLWVWPEDQGGLKGRGNVLNAEKWNTPIAHDKDTYRQLRSDMYNLIRRNCDRKPVAFVVFSQYEHPGYGICPAWFKGVAPVVGETPGCLISPEGNADGMDLVHELGHCVGLGHASRDDRSNFMHEAGGRSTMRQTQGDAFVRASFSWSPG